VLAESGVTSVVGITFDPNLFMRNDNIHFYFGASGHFASEALVHAADMGATYLAISPSPYFGRIAQYHPDIEAQLESFTARTVEFLGGLAAKAEELGVKLILRNEFWSLFGGRRILPLLAQLPASVGLDFDPAHLFVAGIDPAEFLATNIASIGCVHLTDTSFVDTAQVWKTPNPEFPAHQATQVFRDPGTGSVDLKGLAEALDTLGYQGPIVASARQTRDPFRALLRTRALLNQLQK
jgi:sugar phosphate isomerase/epimerase